MKKRSPNNFFYNLNEENSFIRKSRFAVFLDRDGVIIEDKNYLKELGEIEFIPGSIEALRRLNLKSIFVAVVSNQAGVARGMMKLKDVHNVNLRFINLLEEHNVKINCLMFCPYHPEGIVSEFTCDSNLRKPNSGMFEFIKDFYKLSIKTFYMVGDKYSDVVFGKNIGAKACIVKTGYGNTEWEKMDLANKEVRRADNLLEAVKWLMADIEKKKKRNP